MVENVHRIKIVAYDRDGEPLRSTEITRYEIEDGFLNKLPYGCPEDTEQPMIWERLRQVAGFSG